MLRLSVPTISEAAIGRVGEVLRSGRLVQGQEAHRFELELANFIGCKHAVVVSSGTAALYLAIKSLDIGPGDAVIVPGFTFPATINAVILSGARPLIVDVDPRTYCIDVSKAREAIAEYRGSEVLRAVLLVHQFGVPCDMVNFTNLCADLGLTAIEDAACALGSKNQFGSVGSNSDIACFSFHPRKILTTGEGGLLTTDKAGLANRIRRLRNHGIVSNSGRIDFVEPALNFRMTDFQAALGRAQLTDVPSWLNARRVSANRYFELLSDLENEGLVDLPGIVNGQNWQTFMLVLDESFCRRAIVERLGLAGVEANLGAYALSKLSAYSKLTPYRLPVSERLFHSGLALPMHENLSDGDIETVVNSLKKILLSV